MKLTEKINKELNESTKVEYNEDDHTIEISSNDLKALYKKIPGKRTRVENSGLSARIDFSTGRITIDLRSE